jgi:hypothetical protein
MTTRSPVNRARDMIRSTKPVVNDGPEPLRGASLVNEAQYSVNPVRGLRKHDASFLGPRLCPALPGTALSCRLCLPASWEKMGLCRRSCQRGRAGGASRQCGSRRSRAEPGTEKRTISTAG